MCSDVSMHIILHLCLVNAVDLHIALQYNTIYIGHLFGALCRDFCLKI